ncbi:MAG: autotransporter-associated beta strand repeat-containing protein [Akkermansia sp.]|nr:autotransporter-associated beta strand repeat-containing protein [Akkermansia sp.]
MKLRLPSKLQAALIATLASAAFTTLSSGTATAAELNKIITMGEMVTEATNHGATVNTDWVASIDGSAVYDFSGSNCIYGINDADLLAALTSAATTSSTYVTVAAWINPTSHGGSIFGYGGQNNGIKLMDNGGALKATTKGVSDFNTSSNGVDLNQWQLVAVTFRKSENSSKLEIYYMLDGAYTSVITPSGGNGSMNTANPATFGIGTGNSDGSRENFTGSIGGLTVFTSDGMVTADQVISQMGNIGHTAGSNLAWNGTAGDNVWNTENTNWIQNGAGTNYTDNASPFFGAGAKSKDVVLGTDINAGTVTVEAAYTFNTDSGSLNATSLNLALAGASLSLEGGSAEHKSTIGNITSVAGTAVSLTNANVNISGSQSFRSSLAIGQGATVTVTQGDSMQYSGLTNTITLLEGGELAMGNKRWSVGSGTTLVMAGGTVTGAGDGNGALDYHQSGATIRAIENSTIAASVRLRNANQTTYFDIAPDKKLTMSGTLRGAATLYKTGAGTLDFTTKIGSEFSGSIVVAEGTLNVSNGLDGGFRTVTVNEGATVDLKGKDSVDYRMRYTLAGGTLTNTGNNTSTGKVQNDQITLTRDSYVSGTKTFYVLGNQHGATYLNLNGNTLHKTGSNTFGLISTRVNAGVLDIQGGTIDFNTANGEKQAQVAADIILDGGNISGKAKYTGDTTLTVKKGVSTGVVVDLNGHNLALNVADAQTLTMTGAITGTGSLGKAGAGTATLSGANNISLNRTIMVDGGTLNYSGSLSVASIPANGFEVFEAAEGDFDGTDEYAGSGFRTGNATKYYLVKVADGASATGITNITGATRVTEGTPANSWVGTIDVAQGDTIYYVNKDLTYNNDVMGTASGMAVAKGVTLTSGGMNVATSAKVLHGAGSYAIAGNNNFTQDKGWGLGANVSLGTDWTGTVVVSGTSTSNMVDFAHLVNGTLSTIEVKGLNGWTQDWDGEIEQDIKLTNTASASAWYITASSSRTTPEAKFSGTWSGTGTFERAGSNRMDYKYLGDISQWTGKFQVSAGTTQLTFAGAAHEVNAQVARTGGTLNVVADTDVDFKAALTGINDFTVNAGNTVTFASAPGFTNLKGAGTIALDPSKIQSLGSNRSNWTGTVVLTGDKDNLNFGNLSNGANSTLELRGYKGYSTNWNKAGNVQNIRLVNGEGKDYAWMMNAWGSSMPTEGVYSGSWTGDGTLLFDTSAGKNVNQKFTGDTSQWTGLLTHNSTGKLKLTLALSNPLWSAEIDRANGTIDMIVQKKVEFAESVNANTLEIQNNSAVTFDSAATFSGNMSATGGTVNLGEHGTLSLGGLTKSGDGTLTLHGFSHLGAAASLSGGSLVFGAGTYDLTGLTYTHTEELSGGTKGYATATDVVRLANVTGGTVSSTEGATFNFTSGGDTFTATAVKADGTVEYLHGEDKTTYVLTNGTDVNLSSECYDNLELATVRVQGGNGTIYVDYTTFSPAGLGLDVRDDSTAIVSGNAAGIILDGASTFGSNAHVQIGEGAMLALNHEGTAAAVLQAATGVGDIDLNVNATLANGTTTAATGKLTIGAGKTLTLGGGDSNNVNISSFSQVVLNGGNIIVDSAASTIQGLTVGTDKSGVFLVNDLNTATYRLAGVTRADGNLTVANNWNAQVQVDALVGAGTFSVSGNNGDTVSLQRDAQQKLELTINSLSFGNDSFTGDLVIRHNTTSPSDNMDTFTINTGDQAVTFRSMTVDFNQARATAPLAFNLGADATMTGAMTLTSGDVNVTGAHTLTVGGLTGTGTMNVAGSLTINVAAGGNYTYSGLQSLGGKLTKTGDGAQTLTLGTEQTPFLLNEAISLTGGNLTLGGNILLKDGAFEPSGEGSVKYIDLNGGEHEPGTGSGYQAASGTVTVVDITDATLDIADGTTFTYKGKGVNVGTDGTFEQTGSAAFNAYYIFDDEVSLAAVQERSMVVEEDFLSDVYMYGGTLDTNGAEEPVTTLHVNTGENTASVTGYYASFVTLQGSGTLNVAEGTSLIGTNLNIAEGDTLTLVGGGNISYNNISNRGTLGIGVGTTLSNYNTAVAVGEGETFITTGEGTLEIGNLSVTNGTVNLGTAAQMQAVTLNGGSITLGGTTTATTLTVGNGSLTINADTTLSGNLSVGTGDGARFGDITVAEGAILTANGLSTPWGFNSMTIDGVFNATSQFSINTGAHEYEITGKGTINTANLVIQNQTTKATFKGGLTINIGDGGITGERTLELQDVTIGVRAGSNAWTANRAISLGSADTGTTFSPETGEAITLGGVLSGSGKLVKDGEGTLTLNGANTFTGDILVSDGSIVMGNKDALGASNATGGRTITIETGGTVDINGQADTIYKYTLAGGSLVNNGDDTIDQHVQNAELTLTASSSVGGSGKMYMIAGGWGTTTANLNNHTLTKTGEGTFSFINTDITPGILAVEGGTVEFSAGATHSRVQAAITLDGGTITGAYRYEDSEDAVIRTLTALQTVEASAAIELGSNVTLAIGVDNGQTLTLTGAITGPGAISKDGEGALVLGGDSTTNVINQAITLEGGTLSFGGTVDITALEPTGEPVREFVGGMTEGSGNGFASDSAAYQLVTVNDGQIDLAASAGATFMHGEMEGELNANGEVVLDGVTSYLTYFVNNAVAEDADVDTLGHAIDTAAAQEPAVTLATLQMAAAGTRLAVDRTDSVENLTVTAGDGSASLVNLGEGGNTLTVTNLALNGKLNVGAGVALNLATALSGTAPDLANLANNGGTVSIALANSDNVLTMDAASTGTLELRSGAISYRSVIGSQTLRMGNGTKLLFGSNADGQVDAPVFANNIVMDGNMEIAVYGKNFHELTTITGAISGTGKLTKTDGGNMVFSNSVSVGSLEISGGTIDFNGSTQLASTGSLTVNGGSTANFNSTEDMTFQSLSVAGNDTKVNFAGHVEVTGSARADFSYSTVVTGLVVTFADGFDYSHEYTTAQKYALVMGKGATTRLGGVSNMNNSWFGFQSTSELILEENAVLNNVGSVYNASGNNGKITLLNGSSMDVKGNFYSELLTNNGGALSIAGSSTVTTLSANGGTATFNGAATVTTLNANGGTTTFNGTTTITNLAAGGTGAVVAGSGAITVSNATRDQGVRIAKGKDLTLTTANLTATTLYNLGTLIIGDGTTPTLVKTTYFVNGNMQDRSVTTGFEIKSGATVAISGGDGGNTHETGLVLSEWENGSTATVAGNLLAQNATLLGGNTDGFTLNISNGGVVAVKGIKSNGNQDHAVNLNDGGKLVFGGTTSGNRGGTLNAQAGSTIGISADTASYNGAIVTTAADGKAVKIDTAKYAFNADGTAIEQGTDGGTLNLSGAVSGDATIQKVGAGTANITGSTASFNGSVDVEAGVLNIMNAASVNVQDVTIGAGATMGVYTGTTAGGDNVGSISIEQGKVLTAGDAAQLNANLTMKEGSVMDVSAAQGSHGLNLGCSLTIEPGATLSDKDMTAISGLSMENRWYYISTSVEQLHITGIGDWDATQGDQLSCVDYRHVQLDASEVYTNLESQKYAMVYNWSNSGENVGTYTLAIYLIPEPTTSTLSLLALCALAARRRRK